MYNLSRTHSLIDSIKSQFKSSRFSTHQGFSLIEVMVTAAVAIIVSLSMAQIISNQRTASNYLERKSESLEYKNLITLNFENANLCTCQLNPNLTADNTNDSNLTFDSTITNGTQFMSIKRIRDGCLTNSNIVVEENQRLNSGLKVRTVNIVNLRPDGMSVNQWRGEWQITWDNPNNVAIKEIKIPQVLSIDPNSPATARTVLACGSAAADTCTSSGGTRNANGDCENYVGQMIRAELQRQSGNTTISVVDPSPSTSYTITTIPGAPANCNLSGRNCSTQFVARNPASVVATSAFKYFQRVNVQGTNNDFAGIGCDEANGWKVVGCTNHNNGSSGNDVEILDNTCFSNDMFQTGRVIISVTCVKNLL